MKVDWKKAFYDYILPNLTLHKEEANMKKTNDFSGWVTAERNYEKKWMIDSTGEEVCREVPGHKLHFYLEKKGKKYICSHKAITLRWHGNLPQGRPRMNCGVITNGEEILGLIRLLRKFRCISLTLNRKDWCEFI